MSSHSILIYGAANCEIAGALDFELNRITQINQPDVKIFARGYLFNNSCMSMYRRFKGLKDNVQEVTQGGMHEYFYNGAETIKTCELKMSTSSEKALEDFLNEGVQRLMDDEIILILIGQGNLDGMFMDFLQNPAFYMPYENIFKIINQCFKGKIKKLHLIIDVSNWHNVYMPLCLTRAHFIDTIFIYERSRPLSIFPICNWIEGVFDRECHWALLTYMNWGGYKVDSHPLWWGLCKNKWDEYVQFPSARSFEAFYTVYKKVVLHKGIHKNIYSKELRKRGIAHCTYMTAKEIKDYFDTEYFSSRYGDEVDKWLNELKICTDYYK